MIKQIIPHLRRIGEDVMKKKVLSGLLALALIFGSAAALPEGVFETSSTIMASAVSSATSGTCGENLTWTLNDGVLTISGTGAMTNYKNNESPFYGRTDIQSVYIKSGVTSIGNLAFCSCTKLVNITIPDSVTRIGYNAFEGCENLTSVTLPNSIDSIYLKTFMCCYSLESVTLPDSITGIYDGAFYGCKKLKNINIPDSVEHIDTYAFKYCPNLTSLTIPSSVESIGNDAIDKECKIICEKGSKAEKYAKDNGLDYNYSDGDYLYKELADGNVEITGYTGKASALSIPSTLGGKKVTTIGVRAFQNCTSIKSVTIPDSVTSIAIYAFQSCSGLTSIAIPNGVKIIKASTFQNCTGLTSVTIPKSVTEIEPQAFLNCDSLKTVTIPSSVVKISDHAFGYRAYNTTVYTISKVEGFTINCFKNTEGEDYAKKNGFKYTAVLETSRLAGDNRYATAAEIAKKAYPSGAKTVILASGMTYADALVGVPLASKLNAPILLAAKDSLPRETTNALEKLGTKKVIILGGKGAVSEQVEITLKNQGITTERYEGGTRFGTATAIAEKLNENPTDVFFVYYNGFPDALSASTAAALKNAPIIYLTTDGDMNADTAAYLAKLKKAGSVKNAYIIGGTGVITDNMLKKVGTALGVTPKRLDGKDRYETCVAVNNEFKSLLSGKSICVATGADYPDALAGGVYAAINKAPLFLINGKAQTLILSDKQKAYLKTLTPNMMYVLGGIGVVPDSHVKTAADAWG